MIQQIKPGDVCLLSAITGTTAFPDNGVQQGQSEDEVGEVVEGAEECAAKKVE
jgi:hypothetical protein